MSLPEKMQERFDVLETTLKDQGGGWPVRYYPGSGNWGDALINYGSRKFFAQTGLHYQERSIEEIWRKDAQNYLDRMLSHLAGGTVIYGGGGSWCRLWNRSVKYVKKMRKRFPKARIFVLPSSYELHYEIPGTTFFCRDQAESLQNMPEGVFCHDMAFYIGDAFRKPGGGRGKGYFFRTDRESAHRIDLPRENVDISLQGDYLSSVEDFFEELNRYDTLYTDRLHVCIAGCLLGKAVHLYPGSYFKNRAVYHASIEGHFDNVVFHEDFDF